ncbi:helix-turn-helix domain-containing protein [Nocardia amikacinitolerans]|uniref:helix-turn-helix domain-containing protein n=1 Tax=Nocardia amikacinitolerans TaxID=756689 RepID=UPI0020A4B62B|nr:helix-turn-helix transcriptional regulator [Nocardia amikacinitolerans]MCP2277178.1 Helix-turn-helix domain-containing protein [Nocardia amikacinitolerans]
MTGSVDQQRESLGARLREIRFTAGLSGAELARRNGWDASKVSKIEYGKIKPSLDDIHAYCRDCDAEDELADLLATRKNIDTAYLEWRKILGTGTKRRQQASIRWESEARILRWFEPVLIPGLLQTADYATGILRKVIEFQQIPDDLDEGVSKRMERQQVLYRRDHLFHFVIGEQALYTTVGDEQTMIGQLDRLLAVQGMPRVTLGIIPFMAPFETATTSFLMFDNKMVLVEGITAELNITQPREIKVYHRTFDVLAGQSVTGAAARELIRKALGSRAARP